MNKKRYLIATLLASSIAALSVASTNAIAGKGKKPPKGGGGTITLMQLQDVHGHIAPHSSILKDDVMDTNAGGVAKLATLIKQVRADNPNNLLLAVGDTTHGSAEMLFTMGDAIMPMINALDIDAFLPGNWDFGWGPRVYRQRFTPNTSLPLSPNNRTTIAWQYPAGTGCNVPGGLNATTYEDCHVTKATFPTVAINLYNYNEVAGATTPGTPLGPRVHAPYIIKEVDGKKVAIIGITSDVVPQQAQAFNTGFRFTMGYKELPQDIAAARAEGADLIVVLSELGLAKNVQLVKEFPEINVMFSGHTHERTPEAIVINRPDENGDNFGIVTEAGEDEFLGRLDVKVSGGRLTSWEWDLIEASSSVVEDPAIKAMVDEQRKTFVSGPDFECHTFGVNAFPFGKGHTLCEPLDAIAGYTDPTIERFDVLEEVANNVMVDAFVDLARDVDPNLNADNSLSTTNGFRFDVTILGRDDGFSGAITIGDLYAYYPIGAAVALAEFTGGRLLDHWEGILNNVFDPNPYRQRGGWFLGFPANMHFDLELNDDFPRTISDGKRIDLATINGKRLDRSKTYTLASCYPHGNPIDEVCRTSGATNVRFINGTRETTGPTDVFGNRQLDVNGSYAIVAPANSENIFDPVRFNNGVNPTGPLFLKVAPDNFVHPVDALRRYLANNDVTTVQHGPGRVNAVTGVPVSEFGGPGIVQPTQGAGPAWMKRELVVPKEY
ncbi:2',3'-cyclic-nucleotide 2'-phosphodiesterase (5'-nucleotidase family) [Thiogranum longum]|uniref:2',3'-cyclic-nucleotide 2'-phosphodiesterase (5'-nucleotidase family) n=2 Tax=Thiogranum longum TaxID=1537524 RepID=A0A4R1HGY1_9GAMM|nr:2',3'-cyclic-nucleotide 2'-phosphodiesterase (5'-nucleotidase family) [Thiogranum longum]